jgi:hypothetical protein
MPLLMKNTAIGRRAYAVSQLEADKMVAAGEAVQDGAHAGIYEEITEAERDQGYMTRNLAPLPIAQVKKKPGPQPKARKEQAEEGEGK